MVEAKKFLRRGAGDDAAFFEQHNARGEQQGFAEIMRDEDYGLAEAASERREFTLEFSAGDGIERAERFIHQEYRRIGRKGAGNADALTLAAGELAGVAVRKFRWIKSNEGQEFSDSNGSAATVPFFKGRHEGDILRDRKVREEASILNNISDAAAQTDGVPITGRDALDKDLPFRGQQHSVNQLEKSGLAAAATAQEDEGFTLRNF